MIRTERRPDLVLMRETRRAATFRLATPLVQHAGATHNGDQDDGNALISSGLGDRKTLPLGR